MKARGGEERRGEERGGESSYKNNGKTMCPKKNSQKYSGT